MEASFFELVQAHCVSYTYLALEFSRLLGKAKNPKNLIIKYLYNLAAYKFDSVIEFNHFHHLIIKYIYIKM